MTEIIQWTKPVCQLDADGLYLGRAEAELDVYARDGSYLLPGGCIDAEPPEAQPGHAAKWDGKQWQYLPDHRGQTVYSIADGQALVIDDVGSLPADTTTDAPPSADHQWQAKSKTWVLPESARAAHLTAAKAAKQAEAAKQAQAFIDHAAGLADVPDFEVQTWATQAAEAAAWQADNNAATPMLDAIAAARGCDRIGLIQKAAAKAAVFSLLTAHIAGQRQAYEDAVKAADNLDAVGAINIAYTAPSVDHTHQAVGNVVTGSGSAAIDNGDGSSMSLGN